MSVKMKSVPASVPHNVRYLNAAKAFRLEDCFIITNIDAGRHHLSISHPRRYPTWEEIKTARYELLPLGKWFSMLLPPPQHCVNVHPNCFHLWEIEDDHLKEINSL